MIPKTEDEYDVYNIVPWHSNFVNIYGPVTAIQFLYKATKNWNNIPPLNYTYYDQEIEDLQSGYISFLVVNGVATITSLEGSSSTIGSEMDPLRARMPIYASSTLNASEVVTKKADNSNSYLYLNLDDQMDGYWTLSSYADHFYAW